MAQTRLPIHRLHTLASTKAETCDIWFALDETRPLAGFASIWANWTSDKKVKEGETTDDIHAF